MATAVPHDTPTNTSTASSASTLRRSARIRENSQSSQGRANATTPYELPVCRLCAGLQEGDGICICPLPPFASPASPLSRTRGNTQTPLRRSPRMVTATNQLGVAATRSGRTASDPADDGGADGQPSSALTTYPNAPLKPTRTQQEQEKLFRNVIAAHPSAVYVVPLSAEDLHPQRKAAQKTGHHTRILHAQPSWQDGRDVLIFGRNPRLVDDHCRRVERRAASGISLRDVLDGVGMARGLLKEMLAVWSLFSHWQA